MKINYDGILRYYLILTKSCNMQCVYCIQGEQKTLCEEKRLLPSPQKVASYFPKSGCYKIVFFGGEPFLKFDYMIDIARAVREINANVEFCVTTNGTLLTEERALILNELNFKVSISHDGECYETTRKRSNVLVTNKNAIVLLKNISFIATITKYNFDVYKIWEYFEKFRKDNNLPFFKVTFNGLKDYKGLTDDDLFVYENKEFENVLDKVFFNLKHQLLNNIYDAYEIRAMEQILGQVLKEVKSHNTKSYCGSFDVDLSLDVYGNIYSCHNSNDIYGHIDDEELKEYVNPYVDNKECKECFCKCLCAGGCWLSAKHKRKYHCYFQKQIYKRIFKMFEEIEPGFVERNLQRG